MSKSSTFRMNLVSIPKNNNPNFQKQIMTDASKMHGPTIPHNSSSILPSLYPFFSALKEPVDSLYSLHLISYQKNLRGAGGKLGLLILIE